MLIYFGHPINVYGTELEARIVGDVPRILRGSVIENPNQPKHDAGYKRFKREYGNGMRYFYQEVLPNCDGGAFLPFGDGAWGSGVAGEALFLLRQHKPIWVVHMAGSRNGDLVLYPILSENEVRALSIEETRARVYMSDHTIRPFA